MTRHGSDGTSDRNQALYDLLLTLFRAGHLVGWIRRTLGDAIADALPGGTADLATQIDQLAILLRSHGRIDAALFEALRRHRPAQAGRIRAVARAWNIEVPAGSAVPDTSDGPVFPDAATRLLSEQLSAAYRRRDTLARAGEDTGEVTREILDLRRRIREGGQLKAGDYLGDGRYALLAPIGRGGFATVWRALDNDTGEQVAIKVLHSQIAGDSVRRERFFRGARAMASLRHDAIVRVREPHGEDGGFHYFVMELVRGGNLRQAVEDGRVRPDRAVSIALAIGDTLAVAHRAGLVHRDVKPDNVLLTADGEPQLTDFDLVNADDTTGGTRTGALGTFLYAAPEMMERPQDADARADVYGLGMTLIFMLNGKKLPRDVLRDPIRIIRSLPCTSRTMAVLERAVDWNASARHRDADELCVALRLSVAAREPFGSLLVRGSLHLSLHEDLSPREADISFTSISSVGRPGVLNQHVLRQLEAGPDSIPSRQSLAPGFAVVETPSGIPVVFIVTYHYENHEISAATLLAVNLERALGELRERIAGRSLWMPLMGTGSARLSYRQSLVITSRALLAAGLDAAGKTTHVKLALPPLITPTDIAELHSVAASTLTTAK